MKVRLSWHSEDSSQVSYGGKPGLLPDTRELSSVLLTHELTVPTASQQVAGTHPTRLLSTSEPLAPEPGKMQTGDAFL